MNTPLLEKHPDKPGKGRKRKTPSATGTHAPTVEIKTLEAPPAFQQTAQEIDLTVGKLVSLSANELVAPIKEFVDHERSCTLQAGRLSANGRLNRWATGRLLLAAKKSLKHGKFEAWLEEHHPRLGFRKSSAENYMKLARKYETAERFLQEDAPLREMYERDKELEDGEPGASDKPGAGKDKPTAPSKAECLLKCLTTLQKRMRHLSESGEHLDAGQVRQIKLVKIEIDRFFSQIINHQSTVR